MARNYNEKDLSFYTEIEVPRVRVDKTNRGKVISWDPVQDIEGYAIYKGNGRTLRVEDQQFIRIIVLSTHNHVHNKNGYYPTRENVAVSEIEVYVNGNEALDFTNMLPSSSFTASSELDGTTGAKEAFNNIFFEPTGKGWQSQVIKPNPFKQDDLNEWIQIDLGVPVKVDKIRVQNSSDTIGLCGIYEYRIDVSMDGHFWIPLHQGMLDRDSAFQDILLDEYFHKTKEAEDDWQLVETVGALTNSYIDGESPTEMADYRITGIVVGDISFAGTAEGSVDLKVTGEYESVRQDITNRLRSQKGQWKNHRHLGSNLELLEGMKNTRETAAYGTELIEESLLIDGRIASSDLTVRPVPKSITQVDYYVIANSQETDNPIVIVENMEM